MVSQLDDTTHCPLAEACCSCGATRDLELDTVQTQVGVYCITRCSDCAWDGQTGPPPSWPEAVALVLDHCGHLRIDADQMEALIEREHHGAED